MRTIARALAVLFALTAGAAAQAPPPVPALPDTGRITVLNISSTCACSVGFQLYGDGTDVDNWLQVYVGFTRYLSTDPVFGWKITSPTGSLASIPRPITDAILTFNQAQIGLIIINGAQRPRRLSEFSEARGVPARDHNQVLNTLFAEQREAWDKLNRAILGQPGESFNLLPAPASRAGGVLAFDVTGQPTIGSSVPAGNIPVNSITNSLLAAMPRNTFKCNNTTVSANPQDCSDLYFASGKPWCDVRAKGALGDQSTDDTAAFNACNAVVAATGGVIYVTPGNYCIKTAGGIQITGSIPVTMIGPGFGVEIQTCGADVTLLTINNARHQVRDVVLAGSQTIGGTNPTLHIGSACVECRVDHVLGVYGAQTVLNEGTDVEISYSNFSFAYGTAVVLNQGSGGGAGSAQFWLHRVKVDQPWPVSIPSPGASFAAWQATHSYTTGTVVATQNFYIQATNNGTSASGAPTLQPYNTNITDGTVVWKLVGATALAGVQLNTGSTAVTLSEVDHSGAYQYGLLISNTLSGTSPQDTTVTDATFGQNISAGLAAAAGAGLNLKGAQSAGCVASGCAGILLDTGWTGDATLSGNLIFNNAFGIHLNGGTNTNIVNNTIVGSSTAGINANCTTPVTDLTVLANNLGNSATWSLNAVGVQLSAGACDYVNISHNNLHGATSAISNAATGTHNRIESNPGYNPVGVTAPATMGGSPTTVTAGPTAETHYVKQSANFNAAITKGGQAICTVPTATTPCVVQLGPNEPYITTWTTTAPTYTKDVH